MSTSKISASAIVLVLSTAAFGCMPPQQAPPPIASASLAPAPSASVATPTIAPSAPHSSSERDRDRHVYRFDFVLTSNEGSATPSSTSFTLNLEDGQKGEMLVGKNVPISPAPIAPTLPPAGSAHLGGFGAPRQDVGTKVLASFRAQGDDVLLDVSIEMSTFDPPSTIRKVVARGNALASLGKPALVTTLDDDHKRYQLSVTSTKLR